MNIFDSILNAETITFLLGGAFISLIVAFGAMLIGLMFGTVLAAMRISVNKVAKNIAFIYIELIRGTPMLLQIMFISLGFPVMYTAITGGRIIVEPVIAGIVAIGLNSAAYTAELIRSGIESIDKGQWEAARTLGLNRKLTMNKIILPQAFKRIVPPLASELIMLIKDSSLIFTIGGLELLGRAKVIGARNYEFIGPLLLATLMYLVMTNVVSYFTRKLERSLNND